ncbi:alpha/beta fold hydrolase [Kitasatospora sp. NBC_01560]|uniref:alpha/beta fold hydrolase n=1 Tax=Kitasatospora sp. NBC_01560 TaxID=2975965 RepID=UPI00387073E1
MTILHIRDHGGDGPLLVLLHGAGRSRADWDSVAALLRADHRVLTVDLPGHGRSPGISPWTLPAVVRCIADTLDAHDAGRSHDAGGGSEAVLVGHSLGGLAAVEYARTYPERTRAAVNLDGFWWGRSAEYPEAERVGERLRSSAGIVAPPEYIQGQVHHLARYGIPADLAESAALAAVQPTAEGAWQTLPARAAALEMYDELDRLGDLGATRWLHDVERPLLLVQAARPHPPIPSMEWFDDLRTRFGEALTAELTALSQARPSITFTRLDATHLMILEAPDAVASLLGGYVRELPALQRQAG